MTPSLLQPRSVSTRSHQRGLALITVMLVLALAVILATEISTRLNFSMKRAENWQLRQQGLWYALGAEALVIEILGEDLADNNQKTHLGQAWAQPTPPFPVDEVLLLGTISDLHACFNLNALAEPRPQSADFDWEPPARDLLQKLLTSRAERLGIDSYQAEMLSYALQDWIDADQELAGSMGAEDSDYASGEQPYLTPDTPLVWLSEIRPVRGMNARLLRELEQDLCVRPDDRNLAVNINTLSQDQKYVLHAVLDGLIAMADIELLLGESRPDEGYDSVEVFLQEPVFTKLEKKQREALAKRLTVRSDWFSLSGQVESDQGRFELNSLLYVDAQQNGVSVVSRKYGGAW